MVIEIVVMEVVIKVVVLEVVMKIKQRKWRVFILLQCFRQQRNLVLAKQAEMH